MQNLTVLGTGVLGAQIIFQAAYHGKNVVAYDLSDEILATLPARWEQLSAAYLRDLDDATPEKLATAVSRIRVTSELADAVADADLIIEAVPERLEIKQETWQSVSALAPEHAIYATNSSMILPSTQAPSTDRPQRFLAMHFANNIWKLNVCEIMAHAGTDNATFAATVAFAEEIGMQPILIHKEQQGHVLNSMVGPFLEAAAKLLVREVASIEDIDKTWRISTGAPMGPFQMFDMAGMRTPYELYKDSDDPEMKQFAAYLKKTYLDRGHIGAASGRGFYDYTQK